MKVKIKKKPFYKEYNKKFKTLVVNGFKIKSGPGLLLAIGATKDGAINIDYL